ncbi:hypothetical protein BGX21_000757 [Mortierella sp. AD011]|nr:hypothetical protein BGX20_000414 [Mortierella sp. AD010]KAF9401760.1 hypothetical protein BGX21_000757 [Mortierella sp. AD011]
MGESSTEPGTAPIAIPSRHSQGHQPTKIRTGNSSSYSNLYLSRSPPSGSFLNSPPPMTAPVSSSSSFYNNIGRSRSSSRSGGVVFTTRPRADSEAARTAMEAMVQARLDQITKRLNNFNSRSHELHARTQELDKVIHEKTKRLYVVEDHLLRLQGKPGLSEEYLQKGPRPRRLTNDLEELRMGVKTLRGKFQAAGSVVTTAGWLKQLKDANDKRQSIDTPSSDNGIEGSFQDRSLSNATRTRGDLALQKIFTNPNSPSDLISPNSSSSSLLDTTHVLTSSPKDPQGLRSPPLTPKGPLLGSSLLSKGLEDRHSVKPRPLSIIPDLEEPHSLVSSLSPTSDDGVQEVKLSSSDASGAVAIGSSSEQQDFTHDIDGEPRSRILGDFTPPSPAPSTSEVTKLDGDALAAALDEPSMRNDYEMTEKVQPLSDVKDNNEEVDKPTYIKSETFTKTTESHSQQETSKDDQSSPDNWIQKLWRFLVRAEYFLLGTAVLGAMMPDNLFALCVGFLSAIMYGILVIHHRLTAKPGKEAPQPPTIENLVSQKKRLSSTRTTGARVTSHSPSHSSASMKSRRRTSWQKSH